MIEVFSSFELLILSLKLLMLWTYRSQRLFRFHQMSVVHFKALFECNGKFWSPSNILGSISIQKKSRMCGVLCPFSSRSSEKSCLSRAMRSKSMTSVSSMSCFANDFRYFSCACHLCENRRTAHMFLRICFINPLLPRTTIPIYFFSAERLCEEMHFMSACASSTD